MEEFIWWTTQLDCESISEKIKETLPVYIKEQLSSREGRSGRGRLWIPGECKTKGIDWNYDSPVQNVCSHSAGIVFLEMDKDFIKPLPGIITDLELNRI
jgi:hypothetical protein